MRGSRNLTCQVPEEAIPPYVVFVDTETATIKEDGRRYQKLILGCYEIWMVDVDRGCPRHDRRSGGQSRKNVTPWRSGCFTTEEEFYGILRDLGNARTVAHNWNFDASVIRLGSVAVRDKFGFSIDIENSPAFSLDRKSPYNVTIKWPEGHRTQFLCNTNFHHCKLESLGETFGLAKLPFVTATLDMLEHTSELEGLTHLTSDVIEEFEPTGIVKLMQYCKRDVEVMRKSWFYVFKFSRDFGGCSPGTTVASMAMRVFQKHGLQRRPNEVLKGNLDDPLLSLLEEQAYHGGRVDSFWQGDPEPGKTLYKYDVASMYPSVMLERVPVRYREQIHPEDLKARLWNPDEEFLASVRVHIPPDGIGWLGWEGVDIDGRLCFPAGRFVTRAWGPMLKIAFEQGWIEDVLSVHVYDTKYLFRDYVREVYELRCKAKSNKEAALSLLYKYLLNSLYGKLAQKNFGKFVMLKGGPDLEHQLSIDWPTFRYRDYIEGDLSKGQADYINEGGKVYRYDPAKPGMGPRSICSVAGCITSMARAKLMLQLMNIVKQGGIPYYVDTDSLITDMVIPVSSDLGGWELEDTSPSEGCRFDGPKHYTFNDVTKCKGIREARRGVNTYTQNQFSNHRTQLLSTRLSKHAELERGAVIDTVTKTVSGINNKRISAGQNRPNNPIVLGDV